MHQMAKSAPLASTIPGSEWLTSWRLVAASTVGMMLGSFHAYSLGTMTAPLEAEFGWSRTQITSGMLITSFVSVLLSPFMGMLIDRLGPRRIGVFGAVVYCSALAMLSLATSSIWSWWLLWGLLAFALLQIKPTVWLTAITSRFDKSRGLALAVVLSATGIGQAIIPVATFALTERFGWRGSYLALAAGAALISLPLVLMWFYGAQDRKKNKNEAAAATQVPAAEVPGVSIREGLRSASFIRLAIAAVAMGTAGTALTVNLVPILGGSGLSRGTAASIAGLSGLCTILGRLGGGFLLDRYNARIIGGISVLLPIISCVILLAAPGQLAWAIVAVICIGISSGAEMDAIAYLAGRCFGQRNFGALFGALSGLLTLGVGLGPNLGNLVYDLTGAYDQFLIAVVPLSLATAYLFFSVGAYPNFAAARTERETGSTAP